MRAIDPKDQGEYRLSSSYKDWITSEGLTLIEAWARDGLTNEQIASNVGIHVSTIYDWQKKYPEISDALKRGKAVVDIQVENALLKRALGYQYTESTQEALFDRKGNPKFDANGNQLLATTKKVAKQVAPDTAAAFIWLKNRVPDKWRDRPAIDDRQVLEKLDDMLSAIDKAANSNE